jgi:hypothetical protein
MESSRQRRNNTGHTGRGKMSKIHITWETLDHLIHPVGKKKAVNADTVARSIGYSGRTLINFIQCFRDPSAKDPTVHLTYKKLKAMKPGKLKNLLSTEVYQSRMVPAIIDLETLSLADIIKYIKKNSKSSIIFSLNTTSYKLNHHLAFYHTSLEELHQYIHKEKLSDSVIAAKWQDGVFATPFCELSARPRYSAKTIPHHAFQEASLPVITPLADSERLSSRKKDDNDGDEISEDMDYSSNNSGDEATTDEEYVVGEQSEDQYFTTTESDPTLLPCTQSNMPLITHEDVQLQTWPLSQESENESYHQLFDSMMTPNFSRAWCGFHSSFRPTSSVTNGLTDLPELEPELEEESFFSKYLP